MSIIQEILRTCKIDQKSARTQPDDILALRSFFRSFILTNQSRIHSALDTSLIIVTSVLNWTFQTMPLLIEVVPS